MCAERMEPGTERWRKDTASHLARYLFAIPYARGKRVLDAGTGVGYGAAVLKYHGAASVQAVDLNEQAIKTAQRMYGKSGVDYRVDNCEELGAVEGPFDVICSFENIEHLQHPERFLSRATDLLTLDGVLLVSTPDKTTSPPEVNGRPANPFHVREWYFDENLFQNCLRVISKHAT